jgi:Kef-type K+ transport system membrane component KefB
VNAIALLIGLLVLAYVGGFLVGGRALRGAGLPSGSEFVLVGFVIGPLALGLASVSTLSLFAPLTEVAIAWIALVRGLEFGPFGERALKKRWVFFASLLAVLTALVVAAAAYLALGALGLLEPRERMLAAAGLGAAAGESPRLVVRWVVERLGASGPLTDLLGDLAEGDQLAPLTLVAAIFSFEVQSALPLSLPPFGWFAITVLLGVLLGGIAALLLGRRFDPNEAWGVLLGTGLVAMGLSVRVGLAPLTTAFFLGLGLAAFSPHREALQALVRRTERPVLLPALLLAGGPGRPRPPAHVFAGDRRGGRGPDRHQVGHGRGHLLLDPVGIESRGCPWALACRRPDPWPSPSAWLFRSASRGQPGRWC